MTIGNEGTFANDTKLVLNQIMYHWGFKSVMVGTLHYISQVLNVY